MKKVISINFSGRLINIEEDAYVQLQDYTESLRKYFSNEEGQEEIIADIENRIAEIFYDKQSKGLASITTTEVNEVINLIGKPEDFEPLDEKETNEKTNNSYTTTANKQYASKGRLYRNGSDKMLGGVCSGVAAYFNIDVVLVRVIFAVLLFGAGVGFLLYIILWIVVPESNTVSTSMEKRLYRNSEDRILGGVSSGLSNYFGIEVWIPRIIFAAPFLISLVRGISSIAYHNIFNDNRFWSFSFGGTTTVVYFLLWWIIPEAKTTQEKMAMKGEKLDLNSIKNNVQDGLKNFSEKAEAWGNEITNKSNEWTKNMNTKENMTRVNNIARSTSNKLGHGLGLLIKGFVLFIAGIVAFSLLMALIALLGSGVAFWPLKSFLLDGVWQNFFAWGSFLILAIPGIALITWLCRRIFKLKNNVRPIKVLFGGLFFVGVICAIFLTTSLVSQFQYDNDKIAATEISITQPKEKLTVKVTEPEVIYGDELPWVHIDDNGFDITRDTLKFANIKIVIDKSDDSLYHTFIKKYSRGKNKKDAEERAQKTQFNFSQIGDVLDLGSHLSLSKNEKFRGQQIIVKIQVPEGRKIQFDKTIDNKLHPFNVMVTERRENGRRAYYRSKNVSFDDDYNFDYELNEDYIMTKQGKLELVNKLKEENNNKSYDERKIERLEDAKEKQKELEIEKREKQIEKIQKEKDSLENLSILIKNNTENMNLKNPLVFACIGF
jgi:phage shock protein PspC (stress-responsive transcriptional regulator)